MKKEIKEFLITYGWALLVIIAFILVVFIKPQLFFSEIKEGLVIEDKKIDVNGTLEILIKNNMDVNVYNLKINISGCNMSSEKKDLKKYDLKKFTVKGCGSFIKGYGFKRELTIYYETGTKEERINHTIKQEIRTIVE